MSTKVPSSLHDHPRTLALVLAMLLYTAVVSTLVLAGIIAL